MSERHAFTEKRVFNAPATDVFRAVATSDGVTQWWGPGAKDKVASAQFDARKGTRYSVVVAAETGDTYNFVGDIREAVPNERVVFSWEMDAPNEREKDSLVHFSVAEKDGRTTLTLTHDEFTTTEERDQCRMGWNSALNKLEQVLASQAPVKVVSAKAERPQRR